MGSPFRIALGVLLGGAALLAQGTCHGVQPVVAVAQAAITNLQLPGLVLRLDQHGQTVHQQVFGTFQANTAMPIASASKPLAAAVLLSLVDQGLLSLEDPVGLYLPEFQTPTHGAITLRMCFAHSSGLPTFDPVTTDPNLTLRQAAAAIAQLPLHHAPGAAFDYGNVSMHVAGAVCEVVSGQPWNALFQQRLAGPLGMTSTSFAVNAPPANPEIAAGAWSNAEDFTRFLSMLRQGGVWNGGRVLREASVAEMLADQMGNRPVLWTPHPYGARCGLGFWLERVDPLGRTTLACAPGAFGFFGWLDAEHDTTGVWLGFTFYVWSYPYLRQVWDATDVALAPLGVTCVGASSPPCAPSAALHATTWARDGQPDFGGAVVGAPAAVPGGLSFGFGAPLPGVPLLDLVNHVPNPVLLPFATDAAGAAVLTFGLPPGLVGLTATMQGVWLDPQPCSWSGLRASAALRFDVLP